MQGPDTETAARIIAENVISAFERERDGVGGFIGAGRDMALAGVMRELLGVCPPMTATSSLRPATGS